VQNVQGLLRDAKDQLKEKYLLVGYWKPLGRAASSEKTNISQTCF